MMCDRCIHKPVCRFRFEGKIDELERLTVCCCYVEVDNPDDFLIKGDLDYIEQKPIKRVAEDRHGEWIETYNEMVCSKCHLPPLTKEVTDGTIEILTKYCPNCGAKMDGKGDSNER